ncbi:hypothetical protein QCA50_003734 [Cerrena zonata]|uniref:Uncharacterized protein n=1 Tax=Cerrena zonata TaxID=2478898 RepID=A0AAW0GFI2_9APHY
MNKVLSGIGITDPDTQLLINGILNIYNFIIAIIAGLLCDKIGRRPMFLASTIGMFVFWTLQTACYAVYSVRGDKAAAHAFIAMIFLFYAFCEYPNLFLKLHNLKLELRMYRRYCLHTSNCIIHCRDFAFRSSSQGLHCLQLRSDCLIDLQPIYKPDRFGCLVYVCWLACEVIFIYRYLIETKNRTLEETAALFDGEDNAAQLAESAARQAGVLPGSDHNSEKDKGSSDLHVEHI